MLFRLPDCVKRRGGNGLCDPDGDYRDVVVLERPAHVLVESLDQLRHKLLRGKTPILLDEAIEPLVADGDLLNSVGSRFVRTDAVFVRVHRREEDGTDVAAIQQREEGTLSRVTPKMRAYLHARGFHLKPSTTELFIPGRPFIKPSYRDFRRKGIAKKLFGKATKRTLEGE